MPPKKTKPANPAKTASKDGSSANADGPSGSISSRLAQNPLPTIDVTPSAVSPVDVLPTATKPHKNLAADVDPVPTIIPQRDQIPRSIHFVPVVDENIVPQNIPRFADEKPSIDQTKLRHHDIAVKKYPFRHEQIDHHLDQTRRVHHADFAVPQKVFNASKSDESITFEEAVLPTENFHAERPSVGQADHHDHIESEVDKMDERTQELLENTSLTSVYPTDMKSDLTLDEVPVSLLDENKVDDRAWEVSGFINDRKDVKVFFENFIFNPDTYPSSYPLLQTNIAKRKKRFTIAEPPFWQMVPPELTETPTPSHSNRHHGKTGSSPAALSPADAKNAKKGKSPVTVVEPDRDSPTDNDQQEKPIREEKKGGKKQGQRVSASDGAPSSMLKPGELTPLKNVLKGVERPQTGGSRFDLKAVASTMNKPSSIAEPAKAPEIGQPPVAEAIKERSSWEAFFGESEKLIDEAFDPNEAGTGYDTVHGPTGLRKQFLEDERTSGFFKKLLDELVTEWLHHRSSLDASTQNEGRGDERLHPSLQDALSVIRKKKKDSGNWSQQVFRGAADAYVERLEGLQKVAYPQYDRGPRQCTVPIPNLTYDKFDGVKAVLRREFSYSTKEPFMKTYESQLYPNQDPGRKTFVVGREVLRYYAPMTSAKDIDYDPRNMPCGGSYLPEHYLTPSEVKTCNPVITDMIPKKEADLTIQMKLRSVRRQEPTPRPKPVHSTLQFPKPNKPRLPRSYYNAKGSPCSLFVVRRLNPNYWPERMLPPVRPDAVRPRCLQSTKTWSIYVAIQRRLLRQVHERARRREETRRQFHLERSCYCRQGRPNYQPKFSPKKKQKVTRNQVKMRWSKLVLNHSFTGVYCPRLQPPILSPPKYQHFGGNFDVPETVMEQGYKNPLWTTLREKKASAEQGVRKDAEEKEVAVKKEKLSEVIQNAAATSQQVSTAFLVHPTSTVGAPHGKQSAKPRQLVSSSARGNKHEVGKTNIPVRGMNPQVQDLGDQDDASVHPIPTALMVEEDGISLVIPDKATARRQTGDKTSKTKPDEENRTAERSDKALPLVPRSSPRTQSPERSQMLNTDNKTASYLMPTNSLLLPGPAPENNMNIDHLSKYTFADVPPDTRYSLLNAPGGIDQLVGYTRDEILHAAVKDQSKQPPSSKPAQPPLIEVVSSSILSVQNDNKLRCSNSWDTQEGRNVGERIAEQENKAAEARDARAYIPPFQPRYMMGKQYRESKKKVITPRRASDKMEGDPQRVIRLRERERLRSGDGKSMSPLDLLFEQAARRSSNADADSGEEREKIGSVPIQCDIRLNDENTPLNHYVTFEGRPIPRKRLPRVSKVVMPILVNSAA
ncbi:hypothetical protein RvY_00516 [Ramazzottius varieornatus]|uniref:Uncharacterized protein n=1 Tax=Ramazzottius varieornatus TaxID=947166 RepID=A0A1D1UH25_RAMVA|nr:hypothetical protein RvY_00516 [Ramazzottius varieornatus]